MKKKIQKAIAMIVVSGVATAVFLAAVALLATTAASMGCIFFVSDEPNSCGIFND